MPGTPGVPANLWGLAKEPKTEGFVHIATRKLLQLKPRMAEYTVNEYTKTISLNAFSLDTQHLSFSQHLLKRNDVLHGSHVPGQSVPFNYDTLTEEM